MVGGLVVSALLPAVAHGGNYFLSLSQVISGNVSLGRSVRNPPSADLLLSGLLFLEPFLLVAWEGGKGFSIRRVIGVACPGGSFRLDLSLGELHSAEPD